MSIAPTSAANAGSHWPTPSPYASAVPTITGTSAAVSVFGLAAINHVFKVGRGASTAGAIAFMKFGSRELAVAPGRALVRHGVLELG